MGMTNRVMPAQGEERGASFTLIRLDGDPSRKFQPLSQQFLKSARAADQDNRRAEYRWILPQTAAARMIFYM